MFHFENLDITTRRYMLMEAEEAIKTSQLHLSRRLPERGRELYPALLLDALKNGDETSPSGRHRGPSLPAGYNTGLSLRLART